jgi:photosystem II stability/assembly factor-like uncharacterized protein
MGSSVKANCFCIKKALVLALLTGLTAISVAAQTGQAGQASQIGWVPERKVTSTDLISVYFLNSDRGWIGGDEGYLAATSDGGASWANQPLKTTGSVNDIYFRNEENGFVLAGDKVFLTNNGGQNWAEVPAVSKNDFRGTEQELYSIRFSDKKRGWIVGSVSRGDNIVDSLVLRTTDGGSSWQRVRVPTTEELFHLDFVNENKGWIVGSHGIVLFTEDSGTTWQRQNANIATDLFYVDFRGSKDGWAVGAKGTILHTDDGGRNWYKMGGGVYGTLLRVAFLSEDSGFIVGKGGLILRSSDGGRSWIKQDSKTTDALYGLFVDKKAIWAVGGNGTLLKYEK